MYKWREGAREEGGRLGAEQVGDPREGVMRAEGCPPRLPLSSRGWVEVTSPALGRHGVWMGPTHHLSVVFSVRSHAPSARKVQLSCSVSVSTHRTACYYMFGTD